MEENNFQITQSKYCCTCKNLLPIENFCKCSSNKDGLNKRCRNCVSNAEKQSNRKLNYNKFYRNNPINKQKASEYHKKYVLLNKEKLNKKRKEYRLKNKEKIRLANYLYIRRPEVKKHRCEIHHRRKKDIKYLIERRLRNRLRVAIKNQQKLKQQTVGNIENLIGCSLDFLIDYLKSQIKEGMTWNMVKQGKIHVDHILPCRLYDLSNPDEQKKCFHYTNLRLLLASENLSKASLDKKLII